MSVVRVFQDNCFTYLAPTPALESWEDCFSDVGNIQSKSRIRLERSMHRLEESPVSVIVEVSETSPKTECRIECLSPGQIPHIRLNQLKTKIRFL